MKAIYQLEHFGEVRPARNVELLKVTKDVDGSGLYLAHIAFLETTENYPEGYQITVGADSVKVRGKSVHDWALKFAEQDRTRFANQFMNWLWSQIGKPVVVECTVEPRGYRGLEGYQRGDRYMAIIGSNHCRVYPVAGDDYCELCTLPVFKRFFKEI